MKTKDEYYKGHGEERRTLTVRLEGAADLVKEADAAFRDAMGYHIR